MKLRPNFLKLFYNIYRLYIFFKFYEQRVETALNLDTFNTRFDDLTRVIQTMNIVMYTTFLFFRVYFFNSSNR